VKKRVPQTLTDDGHK